MNLYKNNNVIVFVHIPKTAGSSVNTALLEKFRKPREEILINHPNARLIPKREKFSVNYVYRGHWKDDEKTWTKSFTSHYLENFKDTNAGVVRWVEDETGNSKIISPYSKKKIKRENLNFIPFTIARCPYERFISAYSYLRGFLNEEDEWFSNIKKIFFNTNLDEANAFFNFIQKLEQNLVYINDLNILHLKSMKSFIKDSSDNILVKEILKYENLDKDLNIFLNKYGYESVILPMINVSEKKYDYKFLLNEKQYYKDIVYSFYKEDFDLFNYSK